MFNLEIQSVSVAEFPAAAKKALASVRGLPVEHAQAKAAADVAIGLVKAGCAGSENVYAVISGHANPGHVTVPSPEGPNGSALTVAVYQHPSTGGPA